MATKINRLDALENNWQKEGENALQEDFGCYNDTGFLARAGESPHLFGSHHQPPFC
jgi:hypothetical protein